MGNLSVQPLPTGHQPVQTEEIVMLRRIDVPLHPPKQKTNIKSDCDRVKLSTRQSILQFITRAH